MKNVKFRGIPRQKDEFRGSKFRGKPKFRGSARNSAARGKLWALMIRLTVQSVSSTKSVSV